VGVPSVLPCTPLHGAKVAQVVWHSEFRQAVIAAHASGNQLWSGCVEGAVGGQG